MTDLLPCSGRRHQGPRLLPPESFGRNARKPDGRSTVCLACRRRVNAKAKKLVKRGQTGLCSEPGCVLPPSSRGALYCLAHRRKAQARVLPAAARPDAEPRTCHDLGLRMLIGGGRRPEEREW